MDIISLLQYTISKVVETFSHNWFLLVLSIVISAALKLYVDQDSHRALPASEHKEQHTDVHRCCGGHSALFMWNHCNRTGHDGIHSSMGSYSCLPGVIPTHISSGTFL